MGERARPAGFRVSSRGCALAAFCVLVLGITFAYTGSAWAVVLYRSLSDGGLMLLWLLAATGMGGAILHWTPGRETRGIDRDPAILSLVTSTALGLGVLSLALLGLALAGWLSVATAWGLLILGIALGIALLIRGDREPRDRLFDFKRWLAETAGAGWLWLLAAPFLAVALAGSLIPPGLLWKPGEPHPYDVLEYHLQIPREWYEAGRMVALHHNVFSYFPFNVEVHYLLAMHLRGGPWAGMYLAQMMHLAFVALSVLAVYGLARRGDSRAAAVIAGVCVATVPWLAQLGAIAYDEGGLLLFATLAIGWAGRALMEPRGRLRHFALAGAFAGFACGSKLTAVPEVLLAIILVAAVIAVITRKRTSSSAERAAHPLIGIAVFALVGGLCFAPWLLRNLAWAHNPIFPEGVALFGPGHFSQTQVERWNRAHAPREDQRAFDQRLAAFWREVVASRPFGFLVLPLGVVAALVTIRKPMTWYLAGLLLLLATVWLFATHLQGRFFVLAIPVCGLLIARVDWRRSAPVAMVVVIAFAVLNGAWLHGQLKLYLYGGPGSLIATGLVELGLIGNEGFFPHEEMLQNVKPDATLVLIGDAQAFWYPQPMTRLRYRTVFDVRDTDDAIVAWAGAEVLPGQTLLIDPPEIQRFHQTYWKIPELPSSILRAAPRDARGHPIPFLRQP